MELHRAINFIRILAGCCVATVLVVACGQGATKTEVPTPSIIAVTGSLPTATPPPLSPTAVIPASPPSATAGLLPPLGPPIVSRAVAISRDAAVSLAIQYAQQPMPDGTRLLGAPMQIVGRGQPYPDAYAMQTGRTLPPGIEPTFVWLIIMQGAVGMPGAPPVAHQISVIVDGASAVLLSKVVHPPGRELDTSALPTVTAPTGSPVPIPAVQPTPLP